jgi:hypothetical protein
MALAHVAGWNEVFSHRKSHSAWRGVCGIVLVMYPFGRAESLLPTSLGTFMQTSAPSPMTSMPVTTDASIAAATVHSVGAAVSETRRALAPCGIGKDVESMLEFCFELFPALTIGADFVRAPLGCLLSRPASVSSRVCFIRCLAVHERSWHAPPCKFICMLFYLIVYLRVR